MFLFLEAALLADALAVVVDESGGGIAVYALLLADAVQAANHTLFAAFILHIEALLAHAAALPVIHPVIGCVTLGADLLLGAGQASHRAQHTDSLHLHILILTLAFVSSNYPVPFRITFGAGLRIQASQTSFNLAGLAHMGLVRVIPIITHALIVLRVAMDFRLAAEA